MALYQVRYSYLKMGDYREFGSDILFLLAQTNPCRMCVLQEPYFPVFNEIKPSDTNVIVVSDVAD